MLSRVMKNAICYNLGNKNILREFIVKIGLERIDIQKRVIVETLLNSRVIGLIMSLKFARKQGFKLKKTERLIYVRNVNGFFDKERFIEHIAEVNIYCQGYRKRTEIDIIRNQK